MYFQKEIAGKDRYWRYILTIVLVIVAIIIGNLPFSAAVQFSIEKSGADAFQQYMTTGDFRFLNIDPMFGLMLLFIPFILGFIFLISGVKWIHKRSVTTLATTRDRFDYKRLVVAMAIWFVCLSVSDIILFNIDPSNYWYNLDPRYFYKSLLICLVMIPFQAAWEELFFRGYLMRGIGLLAKNRWIPVVVISLLFGLLHLSNPEVQEHGALLLMPQYIGLGLFLAIVVVMDNGLELAIGVHIMNNLYGTIFVNSEGTAINSSPIFSYREFSPIASLLSLIVSIIITLILFVIIYKWKDWKKIFRSF